MPSDSRTLAALAALAPRRSAFRAALAVTHEQVRAYLAQHGTAVHDRVAEAAAELGHFAGGRLDAARFATLVAAAEPLGAATEPLVRRCADVLQDLLERGDALFVVEVERGGSIGAAVRAALAEAGRAFGAVLAFQALRAGSFALERHEPQLRAFPFARWSRAERQVGIPLVVKVSGDDLCAEALAEFLDGRQQMVLVVDGACAPAPLARLVSPGVLVVQDEADLAPLSNFAGPAIAALVPATAAQFVHDPQSPAGQPRLVVKRAAADPTGAVGRWSRWQQQEQVAQLAMLASLSTVAKQEQAAASAQPAARAANAAVAHAAVAHAAVAHQADDDGLVGNLASWLLAQGGFAPADAAAQGGASA
jgi:hypothetical protein